MEQVASSELAQQENTNDLELREPVPPCNTDQSTRGGIEPTDDDCVVIYNTESILEVIAKEESDQDDDDCFIVEENDPEMILETVKGDPDMILETVQGDPDMILETVNGDPDMILETVKGDPDMILETVKDDVNNCDILETVARQRSSHNRESYSSRDSVSSLIASSSGSRTSLDSRLSSVASVESNFSRDSTRTSTNGSEGTNLAEEVVKNENRTPRPDSNELAEDLPPNWERRVHRRATGKEDWSIVTERGRVIRSQKQLDILTKTRGMQPLKLKGFLLSKTTPTLSCVVVPEEDCLSQRLQESKLEECKQDPENIFEPDMIKKASVSFVSDDGIEAAEDSSGNLRKLRRRRGALLMEDRLVERKDKLKLIDEAMCWLKPPLTKVDNLLTPFLLPNWIDIIGNH